MNKETKIIPAMIRAASFAPGKIDKEQRTAELVWSTGAKVLRRSFWSGDYYEALSMDQAAIRMDRLNGGAPLLNSHQQDQIGDVLGVVEKAWIENGEGRALVRFSTRADVEPIWQDVMNGIIRNISVGYQVYRYEESGAPDGEIPTFTAVDWEPCELSVVPVGADPDAGFRSASGKSNPCEIIKRAASAKGENMDKENTTPNPAPAAAPAVNAEEIRKEASKAERVRTTEITKAVRKAGLENDLALELIEGGISLDEARAQIIDKLHEKTEKNVKTKSENSTIHVGTDDQRQLERREAIMNALSHRNSPSKVELTANGREFRGMSLLEIARHCLEVRGVNTKGMVRMDIAARGLESTSDLPAILANVANKSLRDAYQSAPQTFRAIGKENQAVDFKQMTRTYLSDAPSLLPLAEGSEIKKGAMTDGKEVYQLTTSAIIVPISRAVIINDDLGAMLRMPTAMGMASADLESDVAWAAFLSTANMGDGNALFSVAHGNYVSSGTVLDVPNTKTARQKFRKQKSPQGRPLNLVPAFYLVSTADESAAEQVVGPIVPNASSSVNPFSGKYQIIVEPRLDVASGAQPWYMAGDKARCDVLEYSYLEGQSGPYVESQIGFDVDGINFKVRHDFAAKMLDWRNVFKNAGT